MDDEGQAYLFFGFLFVLAFIGWLMGPSSEEYEEIQASWELAKSTDSVDAYCNFISNWSRYQVYIDEVRYDKLVTNELVSQLQEERKVYFRNKAGAPPRGADDQNYPYVSELAFLSCISNIKNSDIIISYSFFARSANYISENAGLWDKSKPVYTGGVMSGDFSILSTSTKNISLQNFNFKKDTLAKIYGSAETYGPEQPERELYENHLQVSIVDWFTQVNSNPIRFLFELSRNPKLARSAMAVLLSPDIIPEIKKADNLRYTIELLQKSPSPYTRYFSAHLLSYTDEPEAVEALNNALDDSGVISRGDFLVEDTYVSKAASTALKRIGTKWIKDIDTDFPKLEFAERNFWSFKTILHSSMSERNIEQ